MVVIGSDHTGIDLKKNIIEYFKKNNIEYIDVTDFKEQDSDDYPDMAYVICSQVLKDEKNLGISICGTGIGISISCNKIEGIRAALCVDRFMAEMCRKHNNANIMCLGARTKYTQDIAEVENMVDIFLKTDFEGGRHTRRVEKIKELEEIKTGRKNEYDN